MTCRILLLVFLSGFSSLFASEIEKRIDLLAKRLKQAFSSEQESLEAIEALGKIEHPKSVSVLEDFLVFKWESPSHLQNSFQGSRRAKQRKLKQSKESVAKIRAKAAEALGKIGQKSSIPLLMKIIREEDNAVVREYSLKALLGFHDNALAEIYTTVALSDKLESNRILGVIGMSQYAAQVKSDSIKKAINDENVMVRLNTLTLLGMSGRKDLLPFIITSAYDKEMIIQRRTADILEKFNKQASADILVYLARSTDKGTVISSVSSLGKNDFIPGAEYLRFAEKALWEVALIALKSSYSKWDKVEFEAFSRLEKNIIPSLAQTLQFVQKKVKCRRNIEKMEKEIEKIKMFLTDVVK